MMTRVKAVLLLAGLFVSLQARAGDPLTNRGIDLSGVYHVGDIDTVNLYNGNLMIDIPLAAQFPLNGGFSYGIHLVYTGQPWDFPMDERTSPTWVPETQSKAIATPNRRSNAGMGWRVSMGRLILPGDPTNLECQDTTFEPCGYWMYESPDGASRSIGNNNAQPGLISDDTSFLRLKVYTNTTANPPNYEELEFPDGTIQRFNTAGMPIAIYTPFDRAASAGPSVTIDYLTNDSTNPCGDTTASSCWKIHDNFVQNGVTRTQWVLFGYSAHVYTDHQLAQKIIVTAPGSSQATYTLNYNDTQLYLDSCYDRWRDTNADYVYVPLLASIGLPDGSTYDIEARNDVGPGWCFQGSLTKLTLPTRGTIEYSYIDWVLSTMRNYTAPYVPGVFQRTKTAAGGGPSQQWKYEPVNDDYHLNVYLHPEYYSRTVTVTDPDSHKSRHHFSTFSAANVVTQAPPEGWTPVEIGLPFTRSLTTTDPITNETRYLSSEVLDAAGNVERSTYVKYEYDTDSSFYTNPNPATFRREQASITRYTGSGAGHDDGRWSSTNRSDYDHYGHYRKTVTDGNFAAEAGTDLDQRTEFVNYNPDRGTWGSNFSSWPASAPWVLNTFDSQWVSTPKTNPNDTAEPASHTKKAEFCFDSATGFLLRRRLLRNDATTAAGVAEDGADLLTVFGRNPDSSDISGNLISEKSYGGDVASLLTGSLCGLDLSSSTPRYDVRHTYQYGARATSQYFSSGAAMSFKTLDRTIDLSGAVSSERDTAGVTTSYTPDPADPLRIETVSSDGTAAINYTYANASASGSSFTPAQITVTQDDVTSRVQYDSFGRLWREFRTMPGVGEVTRETLYDSANRKLSQSMWDASSYANKTSYNYDFLGRLVSIDPPDHQTVNTAYVGDSLRTSTSTVVKTTDAAPSQTPTTTTERLDRFGRIWYVKEPDTFDANNATIPGTVTAYGYGVTGALARVCMGASLSTGALSTASCGQQRNFTYDNRGFLTSETHPENGTISYTYDALGHALTKRLATAGTIFDLNYTYDDAERLTLVESRNPYYPTTFRASKVFTFAPDNAGSNLKRGKLETAVRHNYHPAAGDIQVTETYTYGDAAGHLTARTTEVRNMSSQSPLNQSIYQSQSYSTLGMPSSITYPYCLTVQCGVANSGAVAMARTNGLLTAVFAPGLWNYATNLGYHPNGMISTVPHSNGVTDTQVNDPNGIPRPQSISFGQFGSCVAPVVTAPLDSVTIASGDQKIWYVNASGSGALTYQWYKDYVAVAGATTQGFTTGSLTSSHDYYVRVTNSCGTVQSNTATVSIAVPPSITGQPQSSTLSSPGSVHLTVAATGTPSPAYQWYQGASGGGSLISGATQSSYDTPTLNTTTQFWVRVSNVGGAVNSATATITVNPSLSAPTSLLATMQTTTSVQITWSTTQGAQHYEIWRRENAGALHKVGENTVNGYTDNTAAANTAYVYQVCASPSAGAACTSGYSNQDLATTVAFSDIVSDPRIRVSVLTELLTAVNAIRAASPGSAGVPVTWTGILQGSPAPPPPAVNGIAYGEHVLALRREMETARQNLLGVPPQSYVDPVLPGSPQVAIKAIHITELRSRAQ